MQIFLLVAVLILNVGLLSANKVKDFMSRSGYDFAIDNLNANLSQLISNIGTNNSFVRMFYTFTLKNFSGIGGIKISDLYIEFCYKGVLIGKTPLSSVTSVTLNPIGDTPFKGSIDLFLNLQTSKMILDYKLYDSITIDYKFKFKVMSIYTIPLQTGKYVYKKEIATETK